MKKFQATIGCWGKDFDFPTQILIDKKTALEILSQYFKMFDVGNVDNLIITNHRENEFLWEDIKPFKVFRFNGHAWVIDEKFKQQMIDYIQEGRENSLRDQENLRKEIEKQFKEAIKELTPVKKAPVNVQSNWKRVEGPVEITFTIPNFDSHSHSEKSYEVPKVGWNDSDIAKLNESMGIKKE